MKANKRSDDAAPERDAAPFLELRPAEIRRVLWRRLGIGLQEMARECGVHKSTLSKVLAGVTRSRRLEDALAERAGMSADAFFPEHRGRKR